MHLRAAVLSALTLGLLGTVARAEPDLPVIDPSKPMQCLVDGVGHVWRVQCDETTKVCVHAPDSELDTTGQWVRRLERATMTCGSVPAPFDRAGLEARGFKLVSGLADAPHGWMRDERQRVFQVNFDLHRRLWLGASWAPVLDAPDGDALGRFAFDVGLFEWQFYDGSLRTGTRHRLRLGAGEVRLAPFSASAVLMHYDLSHRYETPLLRLTTFFGAPRRHDIDVSIGMWLEAGDLEVHHAGNGVDESLWRFATGHVTLDLWHSADMTSFVRARGGVGLERTYAGGTNDDRSAVTPGAALDGDFTFDAAGFHHLTALVSWEEPQYYGRPDGTETSSRRLRGELGFETIVLAINDQPVTLRFAAGGTWRDDLPGTAPGWAYTASLGLRLSLWAPPRPLVKVVTP